VRIAVLDDYQDQVRHLACFSLLHDMDVTVFNHTVTDIEKLADMLQSFDVLVLIRERTLINDALLSRLPNLKLISQTGKISNHLDLDACNRYRVAVAEGVGSPVAPSELCWALIMAAMRHIPSYINRLQNGHWQQSGQPFLGRTLEGKRLGIWGFGKIGQRVAGYATAFGMEVMIWGSEASREKAQVMGYQAATNRDQFFTHCDIVSLHLRLNDATRHIVTRDDLEQMKPDALLVNISRAELIEPQALYDTLSAHPGKMAAIDVFEQEPAYATNQWLLTLPNVVATPHIGYVEQGSYELYFRYAFDNVRAYAEQRPHNIANPEVL